MSALTNQHYGGARATQTLTLPPGNTTVGPAPSLVLNAPLSQQVRARLTAMENAVERLPRESHGEVREAIGQWGREFFENYQVDSRLDSERLRAVRALLFFRYNNIYAIVHRAPNEDAKLEWLEFYNHFKTIVISLLKDSPHLHGGDLEAFIADYECKLDMVADYGEQRAEILRDLRELEADFAERERTLYEHLNRINGEVRDQFQALQRELTALTSERDAAMRALHAEVDQINREIRGIQDAWEREVRHFQKLDSQISKQEETTFALLDQCEHVLSRV